MEKMIWGDEIPYEPMRAFAGKPVKWRLPEKNTALAQDKRAIINGPAMRPYA
jgi:hypothetical protein